MNAITLCIYASIAAIIYGLISARWVMAQPAGTEKMQAIATAIQEGANAYMNRQYKTIGIVGIALFILILKSLFRLLKEPPSL